MSNDRDLTISDLTVTLAPGSAELPLQPVVHAGTARLSNEAFVKIVLKTLADEIDTPYAKLRLRSCRLIDGGAEIVLRVRKSIIDTDLTTQVALTPAGNGDLRATVTAMRLGFLSAATFLEFFLDSVNNIPGLRKSGPKSVDINLPTLLQARNIPLQLDAGVTRVEATEQGVVVTLG